MRDPVLAPVDVHRRLQAGRRDRPARYREGLHHEMAEKEECGKERRDERPGDPQEDDGRSGQCLAPCVKKNPVSGRPPAGRTSWDGKIYPKARSISRNQKRYETVPLKLCVVI